MLEGMYEMRFEYFLYFVLFQIYMSFRGELFNVFNESLEKVIFKPPPKEFKKNSVIFVDNTEEIIDCVIFCTGTNKIIQFFI